MTQVPRQRVREQRNLDPRRTERPGTVRERSPPPKAVLLNSDVAPVGYHPGCHGRWTTISTCSAMSGVELTWPRPTSISGTAPCCSRSWVRIHARRQRRPPAASPQAVVEIGCCTGLRRWPVQSRSSGRPPARDCPIAACRRREPSPARRSRSLTPSSWRCFRPDPFANLTPRIPASRPRGPLAPTDRRSMRDRRSMGQISARFAPCRGSSSGPIPMSRCR